MNNKTNTKCECVFVRRERVGGVGKGRGQEDGMGWTGPKRGGGLKRDGRDHVVVFRLS